jgi:hypothetical protein
MAIFKNNKLFRELYNSIQTSKIKKSVYKNYKTKLASVVKKKHFKTLMLRAISSYVEFTRSDKKNEHLLKVENIPHIEIIKLKDDIKSHFMDNIISTQIFNNIETGKTNNETFVLEFGNIKIRVNSYSSGDIFVLERINMERLYSFLNIIVPFLIEFSDRKKTPADIDIFLLLTNYKKTFNDDYELSLGVKNVNSGYMINYYDTRDKRRIVIFRKEECFKVLLHELIHAFRLDLGAICNIQSHKIKEVIENIRTSFNIGDGYNNGLFSIEESYSEFLTTFIYTLFYSIEKTTENRSINEVISVFIRRYTVEYIYSIIKTINIIQYHTMFYDITKNKNLILSSSLGVLIKTNKNKHINDNVDIHLDGVMELVKRKTHHTTTSIIEYIPLKLILMTNIDYFFLFRENYLNPINVHCSHEQIYKTLIFINVSLTERINYTEDKYNEMLNHLNELHLSNNFTKSLCMTTYE